MNSPPSPKRIRLDGGMKLEELPDDMLDKILRFLPMKSRVHNNLVSKRLRSVMPYTDRSGCLRVLDLPFKGNMLATRHLYVSSGGITAALESLLPQVGPKLKSLSFAAGSYYRWEMLASHLDLIVQYCPDLSELKLVDVCDMYMYNAESTDFNCGTLRRLTKLSSLALGCLWDEMEPSDEWCLMMDISSLIAMLPLKQLSLINLTFAPSIFAPHLTTLTVGQTLSDIQLAQICQTSTKLTQLAIHVSTADRASIVTYFTPLGQLRNLTDLKLTDWVGYSDILETIAQLCPNLDRLTLDFSPPYDNNLKWVRHLGRLKFLSIKWGLTYKQIDELPDNCPIEELVTNNSSGRGSCQLTDAGLQQLSRKCPGLKRLTLNGCDSITDEGIENVSASWDQLEFLEISNAKITCASVTTLGQLKNLRLLHICSCSGIGSAAGFWLLALKRQQLGILTPLRIKLGRNHVVFASQMVAQLREQLKKVGVTLID